MAISKNQVTESLKVARKNLSSKLKEIAAAERKLSDLRTQRDNASATYDSLDGGGAADSKTSQRLRELGDEIQLIERRLTDGDAAVPRLTADLSAALSVGFEFYRECLEPRVAALECRIGRMLEPFYSNPTRAREVAARSDSITYLRSHLRTDFENVDPVILAQWFIDRIDHLLSAPDAVPWPRPPLMNHSTAQPQPVAAEAA